jgi:2,3-bisphosphoglycerate-independent phosphoglycerate mutase
MFNLFGLGQKQVIENSLKPVVLLILDGWGIAPASEGNAIYKAKTPNWDKYVSTYAYGELIAAGESVGLPANEAGNSEVGHLTLGVGRRILQGLPRINKAIKDTSFFENKAFLAALAYQKKFNSKLHLMGMVSSGTVHSSTEHFLALVEFCQKQGLSDVRMHLFTDGRDAPPQDGLKVITQIEERLSQAQVGRITSIMGRYWAMDRDGKWDRTQRAYEALVLGKGNQAASSIEAIKTSYANGKTDEFIEPVIIGQPNSIADNDAVIFFNFRVDRPRQLTMAFVFPDFEAIKSVDFGYIPYERERAERTQKISGTTFKREKILQNLFFVTMTEYQKKLPVSAIAFPPLEIKNSLPEVLSKNGLRQFHLAESEKERMVAFYFDGTHEERFPGEEVAIIPSPRVATYDKKPEMSDFKLVKRFKQEIRKNSYHFFVINFANPDMVAHTGNIPATIKAVEAVDQALGEVVKEILAFNGTLIITADHGNAEELLTFPSTSFYITTDKGAVNTEHSNNPVPILIIGNAVQTRSLGRGALSDVAPTILAIMNLSMPGEMEGRNLLAQQ